MKRALHFTVFIVFIFNSFSNKLQCQSTAGTQIGTTTYDLQTNYGMCRRVFVEESGIVHATWTRSSSGDVAAPDRGTGYNVSEDNGANWGPQPTARLEGTVRTGWPNVGVTATGRVFSISHIAGQGMNFCYKDSGSTDWTNRIIGTELGDLNGTWTRAANDGNNIHAIISRSTGIASGIFRGLYYFRSFDGGDNWEGPLDLPFLTEDFDRIDEDSYFIDVKGNSVAIVIGQFASPVVVLKSTDNGNNWTKSYVQGLTYSVNTNGDTIFEESALSGGGVSTLIDNSGKVHVWFDRLFTYQTEPNPGGTSYISNSTCIMYWNEDLEKPVVIGETVRMDYDQDGTTVVPLTGPDQVFTRSYGYTMVGQPSAGIDASGNLYLAYSAMVDGAYETPSPFPRRQLRDIFLIKSTDGGINWEGPLNVTNSPNEEDVFPSIGRLVNDKVHLVWQNDLLGGLNSEMFEPMPNLNLILYSGTKVNDIVTPAIEVNTSPEIFYLNIPNAIQNCGVSLDHFDAHALDYPDGDITESITQGGDIDVSIPAMNTYSHQLFATDSDGNIQTQNFLQSDGNPVLVSVFEDITAPLVEGNPAVFYFNSEGEFALDSQFDLFQTVDVIINTEYVDLGVATWDESDNIYGCPVIVETDNPVNTSILGTYLVQYTVSDVSGNVAEPVIRYVNVIGADLSAPVIILYDESGNEVPSGSTLNAEVEAGGIFVDPGYLAYDNVDGLITENVVVTGSIDLETIGTYTLTYTITDAAGNVTVVTRVVVVTDTQAPIINLLGPETVSVPCGSLIDFTQPNAMFMGQNVGFTAFDNVDGNISYNVLINITEYCPGCPGTYTITYNVSDAAGNDAIERTRIIIVLPGCNYGCNEEPSCYVGIDNNNEWDQNITIFPNPTKGIIQVNIADIPGMAEVKVFNTTGQLVQFALADLGTLTLDLSNQASGLYFVEVITQQGTVTKNVVVEK
ncbi:MAG: DUF5011 domain-containing protein [Sphingobacteriales bacterium]|nr:MAG: DUF5011 domain-containing protein [Sphingobacteriales bacterium]